jgi:hypothetical protein
MVKLYGKQYTKKELLRKTGDISQIANVRMSELQNGNERGVRAIDFNTGSGFRFTVLADRGMDISYAEYDGAPLSWRSCTGDVAPQFFEPLDMGWLRSFPGGMMNTCGVTYAGSPCEDKGQQLGLHGRVSNIPARNVYFDTYWDGDDYILFCQGKIRETVVFNENIVITRKIWAKMGESKLWLHDEIENVGVNKTEHVVLYHVNNGFPVVDNGSELIAPTIKLKPRNELSEKHKNEHNKFGNPLPTGTEEQVFYHTLKSDRKGNTCSAVVNRKFNNNRGIGTYVRFNTKQLPILIEWKMLREGMYVVGTEPSTGEVDGRAALRKNGTLTYITAGEMKKYDLEIGVLGSNKEITEFEKEVRRLLK